jgi:ribonuclease-3
MNQATYLAGLQAAIQYCFCQPGLLFQSLMHRSYVNENPDSEWSDNETLEFLGDAVLSLAISQLLCERYPGCQEGELSRLRSSIVNEKELARLASGLNLGDYLFLGKGEEISGGREKPSLLADALEALLAAVYLDGGLEAVIPVVERIFAEYLDPDRAEHPLEALDKDYKTQLQELTQGHFKVTPVYTLEKEEGPDHDKTFYVSVALQGEVLAHGTGKNKKEAQQDAAQKAFERLLPVLNNLPRGGSST